MTAEQKPYSKKGNKEYTRMYMSNKDFELIYPRRKIKASQSLEYYVNDSEIVIEYHTQLWVKVLNTLLFPLLILFNGLRNFKDVCLEIRNLWFEGEYGHFSSDIIYKNHNAKNYDAMLSKMMPK